MKYANLPPNKKIGDFVWNHQALLGKGSFGKVYAGHDLLNQNNLVAIKVIANSDIDDEYLKTALQKEIQVQKTMSDNPNCVKLINVLQSSNNTYIITELCDGGDLRKYMNDKKHLDEAEATVVMKQVLNAFKQMIKMNLIHRDLKPDNILINKNQYKLADFGFAREISSQDAFMKSAVGTPLYMSPQILMNKQYTTKADIWSLGNIYYEMLCATTPWPSRTQHELVENIKKRPIQFPQKIKISSAVKEFIQGCLQYNEEQRFTWQQLFDHPIMAETTMSKQISFSKRGSIDYTQIELDNLQKQIIHKIQELIVNQGINIHDLFKNYTTSQEDWLNMNQFTALMQNIDKSLNQPQIEAIYKQFDINKDCKIEFEEFRKLVLETNYEEFKENPLLVQHKAEKILKQLKDVVQEQQINLQKVFKKFDTDQNNQLDLGEFTKILKVINDQISDNEGKYVFQQFDVQQKGVITFQQFNAVLTSDQSKYQYSKSMNQAVLNMSSAAQTILSNLRNIIKKNELDLQVIFQNFNQSQNQKGELNFKDFCKVISVFSSYQSEEEIQELFNAFDNDKSGTVSIEEFQQMMQ